LLDKNVLIRSDVWMIYEIAYDITSIKFYVD